MLELSKELQRFKAQLLSKSATLDSKKQVLAATKSFEVKIEELRSHLHQLLLRTEPQPPEALRKVVPFLTRKPALSTSKQIRINNSFSQQKTNRSISK